jgi:hypothetical protein
MFTSSSSRDSPVEHFSRVLHHSNSPDSCNSVNAYHTVYSTCYSIAQFGLRIINIITLLTIVKLQEGTATELEEEC